MASNLISLLVKSGWRFEPPTMRAETMALPPNLPAELARFCRSFDLLASADDTAWFFSYRDYASASEAAFSWNEFEIADLAAAMNEQQRQAVVEFWKAHVPVAMSVRDDHAFIAVGVAQQNSGALYLGESSYPEDIERLSSNLDDLAQMVERFFAGQQTRALMRFL